MVDSLASLLASSRSDLAALHRDVASTMAKLPRQGRGLLATSDGYWSAVGLLALMAGRLEPKLPANLQPLSLQEAATDCDIVLTDSTEWAGGLNLTALQPSDTIQPANPLDLSAAYILSTSGSTGVAKLVRKTLYQLESEVAAIEALLAPLASGNCCVHSMVPPLHAYGLAFHVAWPLASGRRVYGRQHDFWESALAALTQGDVLVSGPAHLRRIQGFSPLPAERRPSVVLSAGGPLAVEEAKAASAILGCPIVEILGSTEAGAIAWRYAERGDFWRPLPGVHVTADTDGMMRIASEHAAEAAQTSSDRIRLLGTTDQAFEWLGRSDAILKIEGKRVSPRQVESALCTGGLVAAAAIFDVGEQLVALASVTLDGAQKLAREGSFRFSRRLRQHLSSQFDAACLPKRWRFLPVIPEDAMGKRSIPAMRALFNSTIDGQPVVVSAHAHSDGINLELAISPDLKVLEGHFPNFPIVPGVAQLDWVMALGQMHLGIERIPAQQFQVKFSSPLRPGVIATLSLQHRAGTKQLRFEYRSGETIYSSGSVSLSVP